MQTAGNYKLYCTCFCASFRAKSPLKAYKKNHSREECDQLWTVEIINDNLTLLIQKELHRASRCAVVSEIADFWTGSPEREQPGRGSTDIPEPRNIRIAYEHTVNSGNMHTHTHTLSHTMQASSYFNNHCNLPPSLSSGLSAGGGAVAAVHCVAPGNGGNWADAGSSRKQLVASNIHRLSILYH